VTLDTSPCFTFRVLSKSISRIRKSKASSSFVLMYESKAYGSVYAHIQLIDSLSPFSISIIPYCSYLFVQTKEISVSHKWILHDCITICAQSDSP
jgi:hypothetical protein